MKKLILMIAVLIVSCSEGHKRSSIRREQLIGQWRNVYFKITMPTYKNSDSTRTVEVNETNWVPKMGIKPVRTYFWADGTYNSMHIDLKDSVFYNPSGRWILKDDSLIMNDTFPKLGSTYRYRIAISGNMAEFWSNEDCDNDGKLDDEYYGTQRKQ